MPATFFCWTATSSPLDNFHRKGAPWEAETSAPGSSSPFLNTSDSPVIGARGPGAEIVMAFSAVAGNSRSSARAVCRCAVPSRNSTEAALSSPRAPKLTRATVSNGALDSCGRRMSVPACLGSPFPEKMTSLSVMPSSLPLIEPREAEESLSRAEKPSPSRGRLPSQGITRNR